MERLKSIRDAVLALMDSIHNPIIAIDSQGKLLLCNRSAEHVIGHTQDEMSGKLLQQFLTTSQLHKILQTGAGQLVQRIVIGDKLYVSNRTPVRVDGETVGAVAVLQDISELEAISGELKQVRLMSEELNAIIESSFDGIYVTDGNAKTLRVNTAYERITGLKRNEVLGRTMSDLVNEGFYNESVTLRVLETGKPISLLQKIKTGKTVMVTGTPIHDKDGNIILVVTNVRDVTELNAIQEKLENMQKLHSETKLELQVLRGVTKKNIQISSKSKKMNEIFQLALRLSQVDSTVLIQGESGTGKEVIADLIHSSGTRRNGPFIKISCAAIPDQLLESELFGYASGAFTGARRHGKAGLFEVADGGSIFLDEIGEMPVTLQVKLLRVLQEKAITRIGDTSSIKIDVRVIAATNRDLASMAHYGQFRRDLFYRLSVIPMTLPPLRERREDIIHLIYHFLDFFNKKYRSSKQLASEVLDVLMDYGWPGNVRELENAVEQVVVITQGEIINIADLPLNLRPRPQHDLFGIEDQPLQSILENAERITLERAFRKHKTTREIAAALHVNQSTVVRKLRKYGILHTSNQSTDA